MELLVCRKQLHLGDGEGIGARGHCIEVLETKERPEDSPVALGFVGLGCDCEHVPLAIGQDGGGVCSRGRAGAGVGEPWTAGTIERHLAV